MSLVHHGKKITIVMARIKKRYYPPPNTLEGVFQESLSPLKYIIIKACFYKNLPLLVSQKA